MIPRKGFSLRTVEGKINEGGYEEQFGYSDELIDSRGKIVIPSKEYMDMVFLVNQSFGWPGAMISGSKSGYSNSHPKNFAIFNANLCIDEGKLWYGDIDITLSKQNLIDLAKKTKRNIYVLYEMDGRFEFDDNPQTQKAVCVFSPDGTFKIREDLQKYYSL